MVAAGIPARAAARRIRHEPRASAGFHSRLVGTLKLALPLIAGVMILLVAAWPHIMQRDERFRIGVAKVGVEDVATLRMVKPRFTGLDRANRPFVLTADNAEQQPNDATIIDLVTPKGDITLSNGSWVALMGQKGHYYKDLKILDVFGDVNMFHDAGYEFRTATARFDLDASSAAGNERIDGQGPFGTIVAEGFRVIDRGAVVHFLGKSRMVIRRDLNIAPQGAPPGAATP